MNVLVKQVLLNTFLKSLQKTLVKAVEKCPEEWDGVELRWLIQDKAAEFVWYPMCDKRSKRYKDYKNEMLVKNL